MTLDHHKVIVREFIDAVNRQDWGALDRLLSPNVVRHSATTEEPDVRNLDELKSFLRSEADAFPDAHEEIDFLIAEGDKVAARLIFRGTQLGSMGPYAPSGKVLDASFIAIFRVEDDRIAEVWVEWDNFSALVQLGHISLPD